MWKVNESQEFVGIIYNDDAEAIADWLEAHVITRADMFALVTFLSRMIESMVHIITDAEPLPVGFWGLDAPGKEGDQLIAGQLVAAALNEPDDTADNMHGALVRIVSELPAERAVPIVAELISMLSTAMHDAAGRHDDEL